MFYAVKMHGKYLHERRNARGWLSAVWLEQIDGAEVVRFQDRGAADATAASLNSATSGANAEVVRVEMDAD